MPSQQAQQTEPTSPATLESDGLPAGERLSLEQMTRIMDVAAALRKERAMVDQQLNIDQIKAQLQERLLEAAKVSGDPVTEAEIAVAVDQYYEQLHEFREPPASFATFLAHLWVLRARIFKWLIGLVGAAALVAAVVVVRGASTAARASNLYEQSVASKQAILAWDEAAPFRAELEAKLADAARAREDHDFAALERIKAELAALQGEFAEQYTVTILSNPDEQSAVERNWTDEQGTRTSGFYVIVVARDDEGQPVVVEVHDRETDRTVETTRWGEQVPESVFNRLAADKKADGVLDDRQFGVKRRGTRQFEVQLKGDDGQPLVRGGQITSW